MFEAYSVAIKLSLINNVSSGLLAITKNLQSAHISAGELEKRLQSIGKQAALGGIMFGGGLAIASMFKGPIDKAIEYQREVAKLRQMGLGDAQIADAQKFVQANKIIGSSVLERMKLFTDAQGAFRESGMSGAHALEAAKVMAPILTSYQVATRTLDGEKKSAAEHGMMSLNRLVEQMGGLNDPRRAAQIVDAAFKSVAASGRMITPDQLRQFRSYGGTAVANYKDLSVFAGLEPIIGELKGSTTGMGLRTAYGRLQGLIKPPNQLLHEAIRLGIWDQNQVVFNSQGGIKRLKGNPLKSGYADLMNSDPVAFAEKMMEVYRSKGIVNQADISRENTLLFGTNGSKIYDLIMRQMPVLKRSENAFLAAHGINQTNKENANSPMMQIERFHKALDDLGLAVGKNVLPVFIPMIHDLTDMAVELGKYPRLIKGVTLSLIGLSSFLMAGGLINGIAAAGKAFGLLYTTMGGLPAAAAGARLGFTALGVVLNSSVTQIGLVKGAFAAFAAYQFGHMVGTWLNDNVLSPLISFFTNGKSLTLGGWAYNTFHGDDSDKLGPMRYDIKNGHAVPVPPKQPVVVTINQPINLDGKKIAQNTTMHQAREASMPLTGMRGFDALSQVILPTTPSSMYPRG
ncbi:hypothetical protein [Aquitalea aquatilis]|uniref:hypothetical protein n=1 Tax=Aquitalea aquatilis TaxID=1537400 RepID=UPI0010BE00B7|nr:hypothetical protein [Aquitalea aquatilis]